MQSPSPVKSDPQQLPDGIPLDLRPRRQRDFYMLLVIRGWKQHGGHDNYVAPLPENHL